MFAICTVSVRIFKNPHEQKKLSHKIFSFLFIFFVEYTTLATTTKKCSQFFLKMSVLSSEQSINDKVDGLTKPKGEKKLLKWNYAKNKVFVSAVLNTQAYKKTSQSSELKWQLVQKALNEDPAFEEDRVCLQKLSSDSLRVKYHKMCCDLKKSAAVSEEGANLSALPEEVDEVSKVVFDMMEEVAHMEAERKCEGEKKKVKKAKLENINNVVIASMGVPANTSSPEACSPNASKANTSNTDTSNANTSKNYIYFKLIAFFYVLSS